MLPSELDANQSTGMVAVPSGCRTKYGMKKITIASGSASPLVRQMGRPTSGGVVQERSEKAGVI
jgi:hypothetical protein